MLIRSIIRGLMLLCLSLWVIPASAENNDQGITLKGNMTQPYVVKKNDTLWDIANHFFQNPKRWMQLWERNLYITNPDLIYPGNKIWFDASKVMNKTDGAQTAAQAEDNQPATTEKSTMNHQRLMTPGEAKAVGGLTTIRPKPRMIVKEVERIETGTAVEFELPEMLHRDYINPEEGFPSVGYILDSEMQRLNYGAGDEVYMRFAQVARTGDSFDIFRKGHEVEDTQHGEYLGILMHHLGRIQIMSVRGNMYKGRILYAYAEISQGDLLLPAVKINTRIVPSVSLFNMQGVVVYLQDDTTEVSANQVMAVNLGKKQGLRPGMQFQVFRAGRDVKDRVTENAIRLPEERIARVVVISVSRNSAMT
ncbi:MAG: LysM peptidoglycan-binding domain-containing protein, partial [Mariprofundaceae bacterium]|nr:LysM peptidoglycan-binding domain-containing protein [Mariprofundaceae bacterium]